jgi:putative Holliday junction resolvase
MPSGASLPTGDTSAAVDTTAAVDTILAIDWGQARIGTAYSVGSLAFPIETVPNDENALERVARLVEQYRARQVVLGLPVDLRGNTGIAAQTMQQVAATLRDHLHVPVVLVDERLTTAVAHKQLAAAGRGSRARRVVIDQAAAVALLQQVLDTGQVSSKLEDGEGH